MKTVNNLSLPSLHGCAVVEQSVGICSELDSEVREKIEIKMRLARPIFLPWPNVNPPHFATTGLTCIVRSCMSHVCNSDEKKKR